MGIAWTTITGTGSKNRNYQAARKKFGSKRHMWETLRAYIKIIIFETWEALLEFALNPLRYELGLARAP